MNNGRYKIQMLMPNGNWHTDLRMQGMGRDFARGAFFALKAFNGGGITYRLVMAQDDGSVVELDRHCTGDIKVNAQAASSTPTSSSSRSPDRPGPSRKKAMEPSEFKTDQ